MKLRALGLAACCAASLAGLFIGARQLSPQPALAAVHPYIQEYVLGAPGSNPGIGNPGGCNPSRACSVASLTSGGAVSGTTGTFTGVVSLAAGAVGAPSLSFTADPDTGIYNSGANEVAIATGGSQRFYVDTNGWVKIVGSVLIFLNSAAYTVSASASNGGQMAMAAPGGVRLDSDTDNMRTLEVRAGAGHTANIIEANIAAAAPVFAVGPTGIVASAATVGTAGSGTGFTANNSGAVTPFLHKITIAETALTDADGSEDETVWTLPAKATLHRIIADVTAVFDDGVGAISAVAVTCGVSAGDATYLDSFDALTTPATFGDTEAELGSALDGDVPPIYWATQAVSCRFTVTGGNAVDLTTGSVTVYLEGVMYP